MKLHFTPFKDLPIRRKLFTLILFTSAASALLVTALLVGYQLVTAPKEDLAQIDSLVDGMLPGISLAMGFFDDYDPRAKLSAALNVAGKISLDSTILSITVYNSEGRELAEQGAAEHQEELSQLVKRVPELESLSCDTCPRTIPSGLQHYLWVQRPVFYGEERVGTIRLLARKSRLDVEAILPGIVSFVISLLLGYLLAFRYQRTISAPVEELARCAADVAERRDYSRRVTRVGNDEIGHLTDSFNLMLKQIEQRENELSRKNAELLEANQRAEEASQAKSTFLAKVSHELRAPLTSIIGFSEYHVSAGIENFRPAMAYGDLDRIHSSGNHLLHLINALLDLAKIEAGKMPLEVNTFEFGPMMDQIRTWLEREIAKNGNRFEIEFSPDVSVLSTDDGKFRQIIINLLNNANKFTRNGLIAVTAAMEVRDGRDFVRLRVSDTGSGIPAERLEHLFQPFFTGGDMARHGGTGLGLTISRQFAQLMGGDITVTSELNAGSTFTVVIPMVAVPEQTEIADAPLAIVQATSARRTVLVIDDDSSTRELIERIVGPEGFNVVQAATGEEGLRIAREERPDIIILDVILPGMNGWSVLAELKGDPVLSPIHVILLTILDDRKRAYALGASDFLVKPIDRERLVSATKKYRSATPPSTVLVIDDDPDCRMTVRKMLERENWAVVEAENGNVALDWLRANNDPALILLDLVMPEMDGFRFVEEKRRHDGGRAIPVVVLTAKDMTAEERRQLRGGVDEILQKGSYTTEQFDRTIRSLIGAYGPRGGTT
jgi:signal transduction histidine kinase/CheY-like chemotaxis protein